MKLFSYASFPTPDRQNAEYALVSQIREDKGVFSVLCRNRESVMERLAKQALRDNVEASLEIEGIYLNPERITALVDGAAPESAVEHQAAGYADALRFIEANLENLPVSASTLATLHGLLFGSDDKDRRSRYRKRDWAQVVTEDGVQQVKVSPVTAFETPLYMGAACDDLGNCIDNPRSEALLLIPKFVVDLMCIHPFDEGNGRLARLYSHFLLLRSGFDVVRYASLDKVCASSGMAYYDALNACAPGWAENSNDYTPFTDYWLKQLHETHQQLFTYLEQLPTVSGLSKSERIRAYCLDQTGTFAKRNILAVFEDVSISTVENELHYLLDEGLIEKVGAGRGSAYRVSHAPIR